MNLLTYKEVERYNKYLNTKHNNILIKRLIGKERSNNNIRWHIFIECDCHCGQEFVTTIKLLLQSSGTNLKSCGCSKKENPKTHGASKTKEYQAFDNAKQRTTNIYHPQYPDYGGRGIRFLFNSFQEFINDIGFCPDKKLTLDRKNNNGHYEKGNVRWATMKEQASNRRKPTHARRNISINSPTKATT